MIFKNKKHADRFFEALADPRINSMDFQLLASLYLLTSYKKVWNKFEGFLDEKNGIDPVAFESFKPKNETEHALVSAACDLLFCSDCINLADLTDMDTIPDKAFLAICYAIGYSRYGFGDCPKTEPVEAVS